MFSSNTDGMNLSCFKEDREKEEPSLLWQSAVMMLVINVQSLFHLRFLTTLLSEAWISPLKLLAWELQECCGFKHIQVPLNIVIIIPYMQVVLPNSHKHFHAQHLNLIFKTSLSGPQYRQHYYSSLYRWKAGVHRTLLLGQDHSVRTNPRTWNLEDVSKDE